MASPEIELADGNSNMGKRIAEEEKQPKIPKRKGSGSCWNTKRRYTGPIAPRVQLGYQRTVVHSKRRDKCVEAALSFWNNKTMNRKRNPGPEYELVEGLLCCEVRFPNVFHCNFTARPKTETDAEAEAQLFFAELEYGPNKKDETIYEFECCCCCILGPVGTETGLRRCSICKLDKEEECKGLVHHPTNGFRRRQGI